MAEQRRAFRFATELEADCRSCNLAWTSRLCNISTTGCMIVCPEDDLPNGALLRIRLKGLTAIDGTIIWQHRAHAGVRFHTPLHQAVMAHLGFHEPAPERSTPRPGLHAQLVKRTPLEEAGPKVAAAG